MLQTSYYAKLQHRPELFKDRILVATSNSISQFLPQGARSRIVHSYKKLVQPDWKIVEEVKKGIISNEEYTVAYLSMLDQKYQKSPDPFHELIRKAKLGDVVLFCYEKSGSFCHRHLLAGWLKKKAKELDVYLEIREIDVQD